MEHRDMTPDELERFERDKLHHEDEEDTAGPASEDLVENANRPEQPTKVVPPNPD